MSLILEVCIYFEHCGHETLTIHEYLSTEIVEIIEHLEQGLRFWK